MMRKKPSGHGGGGHRNNRGGRKYRGGGGGGGSHHHQDSQSLARQKKHAMTQKDKYLTLARDAQANGDRVNAEYYYQHVEHYSRTIAEIEEKEAPAQREMDELAEGGADGEGEAEAAGGDDAGQPHRQHHQRPRHQGQRERHEHRHEPRDGASAPRAAAEPAEDAGEIPLPSGLFSADESDRAANG